MKLTLSWFEILHAANAGIARNVTAIRDQRPLEDGRADLGWERHVNGAIGEFAAAKALGRCWSPAVGILDTDTGDLPGWHVKATTRRDGSLIVRPHDPDDFPYLLVVLELPVVTIAGWVYGHVAKDPQYWRERNPSRGVHRAAFFVPQAELQPLILEAAA